MEFVLVCVCVCVYTHIHIVNTWRSEGGWDVSFLTAGSGIPSSMMALRQRALCWCSVVKSVGKSAGKSVGKSVRVYGAVCLCSV